MGWTLFPIPSSVRHAVPTVRLTDNKSGKRLSISGGALALSGIKAKEELVIEFDDECPSLCRVRRRVSGDPSFGILSQSGKEKSGTYSSGGQALYGAGYRAGVVNADCGEGWIMFDASPLIPKPEAAVTAAPKPPQLPQAPKPWPTTASPEVAMEAIRQLVRGRPAQTIAQDLGFSLNEFPAIRLLVGEAHIARLKTKTDLEREEYFGETLPKWRARFEGKGGNA